MRILAWSLAPWLALACAAGGGKHEPRATRLDWGSRPFEAAGIRVLESYPPQFVLVFTREMPTPGYTFRVDRLDVDARRGRIVAQVSELPPEGMVAQVITEGELSLEVGSLPVGRFVVEIHARRGTRGEYALAGAGVVEATEPAGAP